MTRHALWLVTAAVVGFLIPAGCDSSSGSKESDSRDTRDAVISDAADTNAGDTGVDDTDVDDTRDTGVDDTRDTSGRDTQDTSVSDSADSADTCEVTEEICDGLDNDCDTDVDEGCNPDGDDYCSDELTTVGNPMVCPGGGGDCDETRADVSPGALDGCAADWNCDQQLLSLDFLDPVVVQAAQPAVRRPDMAHDGTRLGYLWGAELPARRGLRFAELDDSGAIVEGPVDIAPPRHSIMAAALAWSASRNAWAVAYVALDPAREQRSVFLVFIDANNVVSAPVYLDATLGAAVNVVAGSSHLNVFYVSADGSDVALNHVGFDVVNDTVENPTALFTAPALDPGQFSYAWHDTSATTWLTREVEMTGGPQTQGYEIAGVQGDGTLTQPATWYPFPDGGDESSPGLAVLEDQLYLMWVSDVSGTDALRIRRLSTTDGAGTGTAETIASDVARTARGRAMAVDAGKSTFGVVYRGGSPLEWQFVRLSTMTFAPVAGPYSLWFDSISYTNAVQAPFFMHSGRFYTLTWADAPNNLLGFEKDGTQYADSGPVTTSPIERVFQPVPELSEYDATADAFDWLQRDPDDPTILEQARISGDGTVAMQPTMHSTRPADCSRFERASDGSLICLGVTSDCSQVRRHTWSGSSWMSETAATTPFSSCAGVRVVPIGDVGTGKMAVLEIERSASADGVDITMSYVVYDSDAARESVAVLYVVKGLDGGYTALSWGKNETLFAIVVGTLDAGTDKSRLEYALVDLEAAAAVQPLTELVSGTAVLYKDEFDFDERATLRWTGEAFVGGYDVSDSTSSALVDSGFYFMRPSGNATTESLGLAARFDGSFGTDAYNVFLFGAWGTRTGVVTDGSANVLEMAPLGYTNITPSPVASGFDESTRAFRLLFSAAGRRLLSISTGCTDPL